MIKLENVTKKFNDKVIFDNLNYNFEEGETYCIMGKSGVGKTTLLNVISKIEDATSGRIIYDNDLKKSFIFQENRLIENLTCKDNLLFVNKKCDYEKLLESVGLKEYENYKPNRLSGGMKRRLAIARAFAYGGECYFADEPTNSLDENTKSDIIDFIKNSVKGKTCFIVTHSLNEAEILGDKILVFENGQLTELTKYAG